MKTSDVILRELTPEEIQLRKPFSHFGWEGSGVFSFFTISEEYWICAKIIFKKASSLFANISEAISVLTLIP